MNTEHQARAHSSENDRDEDHERTTEAVAKELPTPATKPPATKSRAAESPATEPPATKPLVTEPRAAEKKKRRKKLSDHAEDEDDRKERNADYDNACNLGVFEPLRGRNHREQQQFFLGELALATSRTMEACRAMETQLAFSSRAVTLIRGNLRDDLRDHSATFGAEFSKFVSASFEIGSACWTKGSMPVMDKAQFGTTIGKLLEAFINGTPIDLNTIPKLEVVSINGMLSATPPTDIGLDVANLSQRPSVDVPTLKRKPDALERTSPFDSPRSYPRPLTGSSPVSSATKRPKLNGMTDDELRALLNKYQTDDADYDPNGNLLWIGTKNKPGLKLAGVRFVTVPEMIKLLLAQPWKVIAERAFAFRILDKTKSDASTDAVFDEVKKSIEDNQECPRYGFAHLRQPSSSSSENLVAQKKVPPHIFLDPGLMMTSEKVIAWMPTTKRLLFDMAYRAARDPSRFNSVFNPATHAFYRKHLQYGYPVNPATPEYDVAAVAGLFTDSILAKYPIDKWRQEAHAEWDFYQQQLDISIDEPPFPEVEYPDRNMFVSPVKTVFKHTRYAYFHDSNFYQNPVGSDGEQVEVEKWDGQNQWIEQPVSHTIFMYDRSKRLAATE
ncbi:hypothetical protein Gpo141_00013062 [Globisporangium polare]